MTIPREATNRMAGKKVWLTWMPDGEDAPSPQGAINGLGPGRVRDLPQELRERNMALSWQGYIDPEDV